MGRDRRTKRKKQGKKGEEKEQWGTTDNDNTHTRIHTHITHASNTHSCSTNNHIYLLFAARVSCRRPVVMSGLVRGVCWCLLLSLLLLSGAAAAPIPTGVTIGVVLPLTGSNSSSYALRAKVSRNVSTRSSSRSAVTGGGATGFRSFFEPPMHT